MTIPHILDLAVHVGAGIAAIGLGLAMLAMAKGTPRHRTLGRRRALVLPRALARAAVAP